MENEQKKSLVIKNVDFQGTELMAAQDSKTNKIYVGISYICKGIGLSNDQKRGQVKKVQKDMLLNKGCVKFDTGVFDPNNETIAIDIDFLPIWLAKISITTKMKEEQTEVMNNLIDYQLKAKDILAEAFLHKQNVVVPKTLQEALRDYADTLDELAITKKENKKLKPKADNFDLFMNSKNAIDMGSFAKAIKVTKDGSIMGRNKLFTYLRNKELLMYDNAPYQRFLNQKLFEVIEVVKGDTSYNKTLVTPKGAKYIIDLLRKDKYIVEEIHKEISENN